MSETPTLADVCAQFGYHPVDDPLSEGNGTRQRVRIESGATALLYRWDDVRTADRARWVHEGEPGTQMFAIPGLIESGQGWSLVEDVDGVTVSALTGAHGLDAFTDLDVHERRTVAEGIGEVLRKLHNIPIDGNFGDVLEEDESDDGEQSRWLTFNGYVAAQLEFLSEQVRRRGFDEATVESLSRSIGDMRHELASFHPRNPASMTHGHMSLEHIWVDPDSCEVVALTGFEHACLLPREADIAFFLWIQGIGRDDELVRHFYRGYGAARTMDVQRRERFYRRLVAFQSLFGLKGDVHADDEELIRLTGPGG